MAVLRKRKMVNYNYQGYSEIDSEGSDHEQIVKRRRVNRKKTPRINLFIKLPGELRNAIYEHVLDVHTGNRIGVRTRWFRYNWTENNRWAIETCAWREPSILRVSKQIRQEASSIYYGNRCFEIFCRTGTIFDACKWVNTKLEYIKLQLPTQKDYTDFHFSIISGRWVDLHSWFPVAELAYSMGRSSFMYETLCPGFSRNFQIKLHEVARLGAKARKKGWTMEDLREEFETWVESTSSGMMIGARKGYELDFKSSEEYADL